jgi:hypothetical protein
MLKSNKKGCRFYGDAAKLITMLTETSASGPPASNEMHFVQLSRRVNGTPVQYVFKMGF